MSGCLYGILIAVFANTGNVYHLVVAVWANVVCTTLLCVYQSVVVANGFVIMKYFIAMINNIIYVGGPKDYL